MLKRWTSSVTLAAGLLAAACSTSPSSPSTSPPAAGSPSTGALVCPPGVSQLSFDGRSVPITYPPPTLAARPVDKGACSPASGSLFPAGKTTSVTCQATEAPGLVAACSFSVAIVIPPRTSKVRLLAFGDSITSGFLACVGCLRGLPLGGSLGVVSPTRDLLRNPHAITVPGTSYPEQLQQLLAARYAGQTPLVFNRGVDGELASEGRLRLAGEISTFAPDLLLLLEGVNDINWALVLSPGTPVSVGPIAGELRTMVDVAQGRGVEVLLATLPPVSNAREDRWPGLRAGINTLNAEIRRLAGERKLGPVVDLFAALSADPSLIGPDGLHPTTAGYRKIAEAFMAAIGERFESTPAPQPVFPSSER